VILANDMTEIPVVRLNKKEQALFAAIPWSLDEMDQMSYEDRMSGFEQMGQLTESLLKRKAIPKARLRWFTDPKINAAGYRRSPQQIFESNGTRGRDIVRHPHFMPHLRYFITGPDLPKDTIRGLCKIIEDDLGTTGMVLKQIQAFVRKEVRVKGLNPGYAAEEFFKLAHEIGKPNLADTVRSAAKSVRR
jgi:hypothetical protein